MLNNHGDKRGLPHQQVTRNCLGYDQGIKLVHKIHTDCVLVSIISRVAVQ